MLIMNIYKVILKDGHKFYVESFESYEKIFNRYLRRYGKDLACVLKEYLFNSIEEVRVNNFDGGLQK